ncbi:choice-of-anchor M domain-containing protein [Dermabacteraceae bacterium P13128]
MLKPARRHAERALALVTALAVVLVGFANTPLAYAADTFEGRDLLYRKHVDAAHIDWEGDADNGHFVFKVIDGSTPRPADEVFVRLGPDADTRGIETSRTKVPYDPDMAFLGKPGDVVWSSPQQYLPGWSPVWAGFGASHNIPEKFYPESIELELVESGGPGDVEVFTLNNGKNPTRLFSSKDKEHARFPMPPGAHTHTNWAFTKPGRYDTKWRAHGKTSDGKEVVSDINTITWLVGEDKDLGIPEGTYKGAVILLSADNFDIGEPPAETPKNDAPEKVDPLAYNPTKNLPKCTHVSEGHLDLRAKIGSDGWLAAFMRQDLPNGKQVDHGSSSVVIEVPNAAKVNVGDDKRFADLAKIVGTGDKWELPEVQKAGVPWPGFSTEDLDYTDNKETSIIIESFKGPKGSSMALGHYDSLVNKYQVDLNSKRTNQVWRVNEPTHVHPSIVFSDPGFYRVEYTISYAKTTGKRGYDFYTVFYAVGDEAIANACERESEVAPAPEEPADPIQPNPAPEQPSEPAPADPVEEPAQPADPNEEPAPAEPSEEPAPADPAEEPAPAQPSEEPAPADPVEEPAPAEPAQPSDEQPAPAPAQPSKPSEPATPAPAKPVKPKADHLVLEKGHLDAFNVTVKDGKLHLVLKEDVTGHHVLRAPETVELHVKSAAKVDVPAGFPGAGKDRFFLPQTQDHRLLWPGWDTMSTANSGFAPGINLEFTEVSGPGQIFLFGTGFSGTTPLLKGGATELKSGSVREQAFPAHTHANWVFTKPGVYTVKVRAVGMKDGKQSVSNEAVYTWTVGDEFKGKGYANSTVKPAPAKPETGAPAQDAPKGDQGKGAPSQPGTPAGQAPQGGSAAKDDAPKGKKQHSAYAGSRDITGLIAGRGGNGKGSAPVAKSPMCTPTEVVREATKEEIARASRGEAPAAPAANSSVVRIAGSHTIPANSHVHPNWVFTKPGNYTVGIRQSATTSSGQRVTANATLRFSVGPNAQGVTDGHFDLGSQFQGGVLQAALKDDRSAPAKWVSPSSLTFALNDRAKATAPAGIEFIANQGETIYMVPSSQIPGVPWLGANTMHESLLSGTTGPVTWTLTSVSGPGNVAVFESGNFGKVVGQRWFGSSSGAAAKPAAAPKADAVADFKKRSQADAKVGELFMKDGKVMVKEMQGRTPEGKPCVLTSADRAKLPRTGGEPLAPLGVAVGLLIAGAGALTLRRRFRPQEGTTDES